MPVGAEVGEPGFGVRRQVVGDDEEGIADRDQRAAAAAPGNAVVAGAGEGLSPGGAMAASPRIPLIQGLPLAGGTGFCPCQRNRCRYAS